MYLLSSCCTGEKLNCSLLVSYCFDESLLTGSSLIGGFKRTASVVIHALHKHIEFKCVLSDLPETGC